MGNFFSCFKSEPSECKPIVEKNPPQSKDTTSEQQSTRPPHTSRSASDTSNNKAHRRTLSSSAPASTPIRSTSETASTSTLYQTDTSQPGKQNIPQFYFPKITRQVARLLQYGKSPAKGISLDIFIPPKNKNEAFLLMNDVANKLLSVFPNLRHHDFDVIHTDTWFMKNDDAYIKTLIGFGEKELEEESEQARYIFTLCVKYNALLSHPSLSRNYHQAVIKNHAGQNENLIEALYLKLVEIHNRIYPPTPPRLMHDGRSRTAPHLW